MASINVSEKEFHAVASAANDALDKNEVEAAYTLDDLARKINAALSKNTARRALGNYPAVAAGVCQNLRLNRRWNRMGGDRRNERSVRLFGRGTR